MSPCVTRKGERDVSPCSNTKTMKKIIAILTLALMSLTAFAQHDEQVTVEGKYRPKVNKVNKLQLQPETPQPSYNYPNSEVNPIEAKQKFALDLEKIAPTGFAAKKDQLVTPTNNFLMAGLGTRLSPIFLYKHNSMLTKTLGLGVGVKHNSSWLNIKDYAPSSFMNNAFDVNLSYEDMGMYRLEGGVFFDNDMNHYYGVNLVEMPLTDEQIEAFCPRQVYNTIGAFVKLDAKGYPLGVPVDPGAIKYRYAFDQFGCGDGLLEFDYSYVLYPAAWYKKGTSSKRIKVDVDLDFNHYKCLDSLRNRGFGRLNPSFEMAGDFYRLHFGASVDGFVAKDDRKVTIRPDVSGSLFVLDKKLEFYAGLNGGQSLVTYGDIIKVNPFVWQLLVSDLRVKNVKLGFDGGVRTNIAEIVDLHLGVRYRHTENDPFFVLKYEFVDNEVINNKFGLLYDETKLVTILTDVRVKLRNSLTADLGFAYNNCKPTTEEYAWYRPTTEGKLKLTYDFNDKLSFNTSFLYQGGRYALVQGDSGSNWMGWGPEKLKDVFDLSLGADYKVNDQISAFALIDNVACQKYQLYYNYPVTGIQFFAGVKLRF